MKTANFLSERELRSIIAAEIPVQYRALAITYWSILQEIVRRKRLALVQVDQESYDAIQRYPTILGASLGEQEPRCACGLPKSVCAPNDK